MRRAEQRRREVRFREEEQSVERRLQQIREESRIILNDNTWTKVCWTKVCKSDGQKSDGQKSVGQKSVGQKSVGQKSALQHGSWRRRARGWRCVAQKHPGTCYDSLEPE